MSSAMDAKGSAELFLKYNYSETKDLCKSFLTVVVSILVFSLTFSEKIVAFPSAVPRVRHMLIVSWCGMLIAVIACGIGIGYNSRAGGAAVGVLASGVGAADIYGALAQKAYRWIALAGLLFILSLASLVLSAIQVRTGGEP